MKNKMKLCIVLFGLAGIVWLALFYSQKESKIYEYSEEYVQLKELPAMLNFYYFTADEWKEKLEAEDFGEIVTPDVVNWVLEQTGSAEYISYEAERKKEISRAEWNQIYEQLLDLLDGDGMVQMSEEVVLKTESDAFVCSSGTYQCKLEDFSAEPMTAVEFYIKEDQIVGVRSLKSESAVLSNVYVKKAESGRLEFLVKGEQYTLELAIEEPEAVQGYVCDLLWEKGMVARVCVKRDTIQGNLTAVNDTVIEIEGYGEIKRSENLPVYKTYGTIEEKTLSDIVIANMKVEYVVAEDCVEAVLLTEPAQISRIRVLLLTDDGSSYREDVFVGASAAYQVKNTDGKKKYAAESVVRASELFASEEGASIRIKCRKKDGFLFLCDASGNRISKGYQGWLELRRYPEGYAVVNELPVEQYLCAVVPSEMPTAYEPEALKAQAVCARSYAYIQMEHGDYAAFGAHVDDTTNYQVYNKQDRSEKTSAAVLDTAGLVITYNGAIAEAYYFSTSAGVTGNGEAWGLDTDPAYGYLAGGLVKEGGGAADLSSEEAFCQYINEPDPASYENGLPYFRWNALADFSGEEVQEKIKEIIRARKDKTPENFVFCDKNGQPKETIKGFGDFVQLEVTKRSASGVILQIKLTYENGTVLAGNEYNIRALLGAGVTDLTLADQSKREPGLLPSAYAFLTPLENGSYAISGGGYGHGIGMSQNGAQAMAKNGKNCEEILKFFFSGIKIENGDLK